MNPIQPRLASLVAATLLAAASPASSATTTSQEPSHDTYVIRKVRVFDGDRVLADHDVAFADGRITAVGRNLPAPGGAHEIDGTDRTLLPGFIDAHTHVIQPDVLEQALFLGVTTELDMFMSWQMARGIRRAQDEGRSTDRADLFSAGTLVTAPGGHGTEYGMPIPTINGPDEAQTFVDARLEEGSDFIKIVYDTGEASGFDLPTISKETLAAVIEAAHARDKLAVVHIGSLQSARDAIELGADGLVHIFFEPVDDDAIGELVALAAHRAAFVVPTLTVLESVGGVGDSAALAEDEALVPYLSPTAVANLKRSFSSGTDAATSMAAARTAVRELASAGVSILVGSDAPNPGTAHGASVHRELELLVEAGLTPVEALRAATSAPAARFGLSDRGSVRPGLRADLLLVEGDPTQDVTATRDIVAVWKLGIPVDREARRESLLAQRNASSPPGAPGADGLVSNFESGELVVEFGTGWSISTDQMVGGQSTAEMKVVDEGAANSRHSMLITGDVASGPQAWAGALFSPGSAPMTPADLSSKHAVSFWAKGDGQSCFVMLFLQSQGFTPAMQTFPTGPEWKRYTFPFSSFNGTDGSDVLGLFIGGGAQPGDLQLQIDEVRFVGSIAEPVEAVATPAVINNLVHPEGYRSVPLGTLGRVEEVGRGARPMILISGFGMGADVFRDFAAENEERYRMFLVTPPGFGGTAAPPMPEDSKSYGERTWCRALEEAVWSLVQERDLERPVLVGFSDGFQSALRIALDHPEDIAGIVSIAGEPFRRLQVPVSAEERPGFIDTRMAEGWFKTVSATTWRDGMGRPEWHSASAEIGSRLLEASLEPAIPTMVRYFCEKWSYDPRSELEGLRVPILALLPDPSELADDAMYQGFLAGTLLGPWESLTTAGAVETVTIPGSRMGMMVDASEAVSDHVFTFVDGL